MIAKLIKYILLSLFLLAVIAGVAAHYHQKEESDKPREFDAEVFRKLNYMPEDLTLFCDIAFNRPSERIRKWETDIKVEIMNISDIDLKSIKEVDSIIAILRPLIAPRKIERVEHEGNVHLYRKLDKVQEGRIKGKYYALFGKARINEPMPYSMEIFFAEIYDDPYSSTQTLIHEFEHILGLEHPLMIYPYYLTIGRSVNPQDYTAYREWRTFKDVPFYLSEQEKGALRMLYSPEIKSGMHRNEFIKAMDLN